MSKARGSFVAHEDLGNELLLAGVFGSKGGLMALSRCWKILLLSSVLLLWSGTSLAWAEEKESKDEPKEATVQLKDSSKAKTSIVKLVRPVYPPEAKNKGIEGLVKIDVTVNEKGEVIKAVATSGPEELREAALTAVRQWQYKPLGKDFIVTVDVNFKLGHKEAEKAPKA